MFSWTSNERKVRPTAGLFCPSLTFCSCSGQLLVGYSVFLCWSHRKQALLAAHFWRSMEVFFWGFQLNALHWQWAQWLTFELSRCKPKRAQALCHLHGVDGQESSTERGVVLTLYCQGIWKASRIGTNNPNCCKNSLAKKFKELERRKRYPWTRSSFRYFLNLVASSEIRHKDERLM